MRFLSIRITNAVWKIGNTDRMGIRLNSICRVSDSRKQLTRPKIDDLRLLEYARFVGRFLDFTYLAIIFFTHEFPRDKDSDLIARQDTRKKARFLKTCNLGSNERGSV